jgi:ankyrin repeat protein
MGSDMLGDGGAATPLHVAALYGAPVNARSTDGSLPLHDAAHGGHVPIAKTLLRHGADLHDRDRR